MNLKTVSLMLILVFTVEATRIANLYTANRAVEEGDILTVIIVENAKAGTNSTTKTDTKNSMGVKNVSGTGALGFIPSFGASGEMGAAFQGSGDTRREGSLVAKLSVRIDKVYDNGNLLISGDKTVEINNEKEIIRLTGTVRPEDIEAGNTVFSYNIANAEITYSGNGETAAASRPGPIARFFNWLF